MFLRFLKEGQTKLIISTAILLCLIVVGFLIHIFFVQQTKFNDNDATKLLKTLTYTEDTATKEFGLLESFSTKEHLSDAVRGQVFRAMAGISYMSGDEEAYNRYFAHTLYYLKESNDSESYIDINNKYIGRLYSNGCYHAAEQVLQSLAEDHDLNRLPAETQVSYYLSFADVRQMLQGDDTDFLEKAQSAILSMPKESPRKLQQAKLDMLTTRDYIHHGEFDDAEKMMASYHELDNFDFGSGHVYVICDYQITYYEVMTKILLHQGNYTDAYQNADKYLDICDRYNFRIMKLRLLQYIIDASEKTPLPNIEKYRQMERASSKQTMATMSDAYGRFLRTDINRRYEQIRSPFGKTEKIIWMIILVVAILYFMMFLYHFLSSFMTYTIRKDGLTELNNRKSFDHICRIYEHKKQPYGLVIFDADDFKSVNDNLGHAAGDMVLRAIATILRQHEGRGISSYRYGGEEFCMVFADVPEVRVRAITEEIRNLVEQEVHFKQRKITISGGLAMSTAGERVFDHADQNLLKAKAQGKNRVI